MVGQPPCDERLQRGKIGTPKINGTLLRPQFRREDRAPVDDYPRADIMAHNFEFTMFYSIFSNFFVDTWRVRMLIAPTSNVNTFSFSWLCTGVPDPVCRSLFHSTPRVHIVICFSTFIVFIHVHNYVTHVFATAIFVMPFWKDMYPTMKN